MGIIASSYAVSSPYSRSLILLYICHIVCMPSIATEAERRSQKFPDNFSDSLRKTAPPQYPHARTLLASNPYAPPASLAQSIMNASPLLSSLVVVREWLHETATPAATLDPGATTGYWRFTRHVIVQGLRTGRSAGGIVKEMDPDAVNRADGSALAIDDAVGRISPPFGWNYKLMCTASTSHLM